MTLRRVPSPPKPIEQQPKLRGPKHYQYATAVLLQAVHPMALQLRPFWAESARIIAEGADDQQLSPRLRLDLIRAWELCFELLRSDDEVWT